VQGLDIGVRNFRPGFQHEAVILSFCPFVSLEFRLLCCLFVLLLSAAWKQNSTFFLVLSSLPHSLTYFYYCALTCSLFSLLVPVIVEMEWLSDPNPSCADLVKRLKAGGAVE
jgi:hypothetical protein